MATVGAGSGSSGDAEESGEVTPLVWAYQRSFRISQTASAERLFKSLDDRFEPDVFLVAINRAVGDGRPLACVDSEEDFWVGADSFANCLQTAKLAYPTYRESQLIISDRGSMLRYQGQLLRRVLATSVKEILDRKFRDLPRREYFVSLPIVVNEYYVHVALGLEADIISGHPRLTQSSLDDGFRQTFVARSLVDAAIAEFLEEAEASLEKPEPGYPSSSRRETGDLIHAAGRRLMFDIATRCDHLQIEGWHSLFRSCNVIASTMYEKSEGFGRLVISRDDHRSVSMSVAFSAKPRLANQRGARKLLETTSRELAIHTNSSAINGLAKISQYDGVTEDLFEVHFLGYNHWQLHHAGRVLMAVKQGQPQLIQAPKYEDKLPGDLRRIFKGISTYDVENLVSLVRAAERQSHGTLLVISNQAAEEALRLRNQGTGISPRILTADLLLHLSSVDGAILLEPNGTCHAFGVILDGLATESGDPSRGARFNSAVRYLESKQTPCLAVVVSEDGGVDLVPDLKPTISRSLIERKLRDFEETLAKDPIPWSRYQKRFDWLRENQFYLLTLDCERVNAQVKSAEERLRQSYPGKIILIKHDLAPDPKMRADLYYD